MVCCAAFGCSNRSEKGYQMYGFPKDQECRKRWMAMVSRQNLQMTGSSNRQKLCHVHFEDDQFTSTKKGGKVKLRPDAVPTIFIHRPKPKRWKPPSVRVPPAPIQTTTDHTYYKKCKFDQIRALGQEKKKGIRWGKETIKKAIQIQFTAGSTVYKTLQQMQIPLPNIRTLQRRMQHVKLEPGVLGEVFEMLRLKAGGMSEMERECVLSLDEMSITPGVELHVGTGKLFGNIMLPDHEGQATHALVFMLAGVTTRWKQVVVYCTTIAAIPPKAQFTGPS
ncbi:hypothetical protein PO909_010389 [Leuciscus waleckii]